MSNPISPEHYKACGVECIDIIRDIDVKSAPPTYAFFLWASAFQYAFRCWTKGRTIEDMKKAIWYLQKAVEELESNEASAVAEPNDD